MLLLQCWYKHSADLSWTAQNLRIIGSAHLAVFGAQMLMVGWQELSFWRNPVAETKTRWFQPQTVLAQSKRIALRFYEVSWGTIVWGTDVSWFCLLRHLQRSNWTWRSQQKTSITHKSLLWKRLLPNNDPSAILRVARDCKRTMQNRQTNCVCGVSKKFCEQSAPVQQVQNLLDFIISMCVCGLLLQDLQLWNLRPWHKVAHVCWQSPARHATNLVIGMPLHSLDSKLPETTVPALQPVQPIVRMLKVLKHLMFLVASCS